MSPDTNLEPETTASGAGFLDDLSLPVRRYQYRGINGLLDTLKMERSRQQEDFDASEWVLFTGVDKQTFSRDFLNSDNELIARCWNSYDSSHHLLLAEMTVSRAHEIAATEFQRILTTCLIPMGLNGCLKCFGSATCVADDGSAKQPDCQFLPKRPPPGRTTKWPSLVIESGLSESPSKLMSDARFWLYESQGDVQMVITIKIGRSSPSISLESWELVDGRAKRQQSVTVSKGGSDTIHVRGDPLVINFDKLFLRSPSCPREVDICFDRSILEEFATDVWEEQEF